MKILVLMKRFGTNKDMPFQDFGRQIRLFENLAKKHKIDFFVPDYKEHLFKDLKLHGMNFFIRPYSFWGHFSFMREFYKIVLKGKYEVIVGTTDPVLGILAVTTAGKLGIKSIYEMQDAYETYSTYRIPFIGFFDRKAVSESDFLITASESLKKRFSKIRKCPITVIQNGIEQKNSWKMPKEKARKLLGIPNGKIIVYAGEISRLKGVDTLIDAFMELRKTHDGVELLLCGKVVDIAIPHDHVIHKQYEDRKLVIAALRASDAGVIPNPKNRFSEFCFPLKAAEYMAAGLPIVATSIGDIPSLLSSHKKLLCRPSSKKDMAEKLILAIKETRKIDYSDILKNLTWKSLSVKLESIIKKW